MNRVAELPSRNPFSAAGEIPSRQRNLPVLSGANSSDALPADPMDVSPPTSFPTAPPVQNCAEGDQGGPNNTNGSTEAGGINVVATNQNIGAAAAAQQPKVVQTAFIHKLYNMLEDHNIQHLISWSSSNESFVMSPTSEFSKVLAQYFKHTNISSFVRQLNMYGFHKVSDVFHTGSPDSALWEFKHGNGNFKRGDLIGLREIKRRVSRHALIHRDSFSGHKTAASQPGTPAEPMPDTGDLRLMGIEHTLYEIVNRLTRVEDSHALLSTRCQALAESLVKCHQWTHSISQHLTAMVPDRDNPLLRDVAKLQRDIERQLDTTRVLENPHENLLPGRHPFFSIDPGPPLSPRQVPLEESRRPSIVDATKNNNAIRPPVPNHIPVSPRRYGSFCAGNSPPNYNRQLVPPQPSQPSQPHPLSISSPPGPNLGRRHTSADIRQHGWPHTGSSSPFPPGNGPVTSSSPWPPSPHRVPTSNELQLRESLAQYEINPVKRRNDMARHVTPPPLITETNHPSTFNADSGWGGGTLKFHRQESSLPTTRRSSVVSSNVHSLLNPTETAERADENDILMGEDRKRKRLQ